MGRASIRRAGEACAGAPFVFLAALPLLTFPSDAVMRSVILTAMAVFTVHMPIVAGAFGLHGDEDADAPLPRAAYYWLLLLWIVTEWGFCLLWR